MKTAGEIKDSILYQVGRYLEHKSSEILACAVVALVKESQDDAVRHGLTLAAGIARTYNKAVLTEATRKLVEKTIHAARDNYKGTI